MPAYVRQPDYGEAGNPGATVEEDGVTVKDAMPTP